MTDSPDPAEGTGEGSTSGTDTGAAELINSSDADRSDEIDVAVVPRAALENYPGLAAEAIYSGPAHRDPEEDEFVFQIESKPHNDLLDIAEVREIAPELYEIVVADLASQTRARDTNVANSTKLSAQEISASRASATAITRAQWFAFCIYLGSVVAAVVAVVVTEKWYAAGAFMTVPLLGVVRELLRKDPVPPT